MTAGVKKPWGVVATLAWAVLAMAVGQGAGLAAMIWRLGEVAPESLATAQYDGPLIALVTLIANPLQIAVLAWAARRRGAGAADYFALCRFGARELAVGVASVAALVAALEIFGTLIGQDAVSPFQIDVYTTTTNLPWLLALFVAVVIVAPLGEEIAFRGFLFRGFVGAYPVAGIVVVSLLWTALHIQYDWFGLLQVFAIGLLLGWVRWRTGSTSLTVVLHALVNLESAVETVIKVGWPW
jgi:membrane protease YdiL (CAAX protease family)